MTAAKRNKNSEKGAATEELVASYFRKAGYFVVRGVPFNYAGFSVTDIDLWLYLRSSSISRELAIVDIKNKKTPQAMERIFWTKGLQTALGVDRAIVATTDSREEVTKFAEELSVSVLDGKFLKRLAKTHPSLDSRYSVDDVEALLKSETLGKLDGDWQGKLNECKCKLTEGLSFDSFNFWIAQAEFFAEQVVIGGKQQQLAFRCFYQVVSYLAICADFLLKNLSFMDTKEKKEALLAGFTYGSGGKAGVQTRIEQSLDLLGHFSDVPPNELSGVRRRIESAFDGLQTKILVEFFASSTVAKEIFHVAIELDNLSYDKSICDHSNASVPTKSLIGCLLDYWGIERGKFKD